MNTDWSPVDAGINGTPVTEELNEWIEQTCQEDREGKCTPCYEAFFEELDRMIARMEEREKRKTG